MNSINAFYVIYKKAREYCLGYNIDTINMKGNTAKITKSVLRVAPHDLHPSIYFAPVQNENKY